MPFVSSLATDYANPYQNTSVKRNNVQRQEFISSLEDVSNDALLNELERKFGVKINVQDVNKSDIKRHAMNAVGNGNVTIAANILEEMANDTRSKQLYEKKIQDYFDSIPGCVKSMESSGFTVIATGVTVHPDGTTSYWVFFDLSPKEKEKIRREQESSDAEKAKKKEEQAKMTKEAASKRVCSDSTMDGLLTKCHAPLNEGDNYSDMSHYQNLCNGSLWGLS